MSKKVVILFFPSAHQDGNDSGYPWSVLHLERMIRHLDLEVILLDERLEKDYKNRLVSLKGRILFAGVSAILGQQVIGGMKFSETIKAVTNVPVIWGGWFPTVFPEMLLNDGYADYVCIGQGEIPFQYFTERMIHGQDISDIAGIGYKKNGQIVINPNQRLINPKEFPAIDKTLIDPNKLFELNEKDKPGERVFNYFVSFGCPYNCGFCNVSLVFGTKWYSKDISEILEDLKYFVTKAHISQIIFNDDNFFASKKFVMEFCDQLIRSGLKFTWSAQAQVNYFLKHFNDDDIAKLYEAGFRRIIVGAESGHQETLNFVNKRIKVQENLDILKVCKKHKIMVRLHTMICFPYDPDTDFWLTMNLIGKAILAYSKVEINISFFKPIPKTPLYDLCLKEGYQSPQSLSELISSFSKRAYAPWYKQNYHKKLKNFVHFYFLFANPYFYKNYTGQLKIMIYVLNKLLFPIIRLRFKSGFLKFPIEAFLFKRIINQREKYAYYDTLSVNKNKYMNQE